MYTQLVSNVYIIGQIPNSIPLNEIKCVSECDGLNVTGEEDDDIAVVT